MLFDQITIVGVGLIGGSVGLAAKARGVARRVVGFDRAPLATALRLGVVDRAATDITDAVRDSELIVVCTPVDRIAGVIVRAAAHAAPGTIFTDGGSTKAGIVKVLKGVLPTEIEYVPAHPIAGSEKNGVENAHANLFADRLTVLTPPSPSPVVEKVAAFWKALGSRVHVMNPDDHDRTFAATSHLPHAVAATLAGITPVEWLPLSAGGFRDTTRVAGGDPELWGAIFRANRDEVLAAVDRFAASLVTFRTLLESGDGAGLVRWLAEAKQVREMLWELEIRPQGRDGERERVCDEFDLLTHGERGGDLVTASARGFLLEGDLCEADVQRLTTEVLVDSLVETGEASLAGTKREPCYTVLLKPGVMDPVAQTILDAAKMLKLPVTAVRTFRRYYGPPDIPSLDRDTLFRKVLANDAIEQVVVGPVKADHLGIGSAYTFNLVTVPIAALDDAGLVKLSKENTLALTLDEMKTVQQHFKTLGREPTDCELETIAQTWSEHCSHKTLKGTITLTDKATGETRTYKNLLKETVFAATQTIRQKFGADDWCVSVFVDNAGVVKFDDNFHLCFKVETHNHPSAIEPYGGANTGLGGVIRDVLGTGLAAKPICNTDVFCFASPDFPPDQLPQGVLHPRRVMRGVVAGVRDYGNRMGIPTVNGAIAFDDRYLANPLVFCGTVGILPKDKAFKEVKAGDLIVALGGRTGRDGIHGATFSSLELTHESETVSGGAVQIGNAITEKKVMDVILQARDRDLFTAITDCGAGGFSSAVGEMGAELGATVQLENAPLKYDGLSYTEIWISESQERMVLSVPPAKLDELKKLCDSEDVELAVLGTFDGSGRLKLAYHGNVVADLEMHFLHDGRPTLVRNAIFEAGPCEAGSQPGVEGLPASQGPASKTASEVLLAILGSYSVCSKEWVIRQYDHEVQGGSVVKPLVGVANDGPSDAAVVMPVLGSWAGAAIGCGLNPRYGEHDPYWMAAAAIDEALRNVVAVGADPKQTAILDNFCWGNVNDAAVLGSIVRAAEACRDVAIAFGTPFISGKDSLNNTYAGKGGERLDIPHTLLVSALGKVADVRKCVTMDLKEAGNGLYVVGVTKDEMAGSHYHLVTGGSGGSVPRVDLELAPKLFAAVHTAISQGLVRSCHDLSEGGLAVAVAEMAFAGGIGADVATLPGEGLPDEVRLFSESTTRFVIEAKPEHAAALASCFAGLPFVRVGNTVADARLHVAGSNGEWAVWVKLSELKEAWQKPLRW